MAPAPKVKAKYTTPFKASAAKAAPKGLQLSAAQQKAYNTAYNAASTAAYNKIALSSAAQAFKKYRLQAAYATAKQYSIKKSQAKAAAIAYNATRMSWNQSKEAKQNANLQNIIEQDMYNHASKMGQLQYAQAGEKAYVRRAVMRTVTTNQAMSYERAVSKAVSKTAKAAAKSTTGKGLTKAQTSAITRSATQAGLKAAKAVKSRTAPAPWETNPAFWFSNQAEGTCVPVAIANSLLWSTGVRLTDDQFRELVEESFLLAQTYGLKAPTIEHGLKAVSRCAIKIKTDSKPSWGGNKLHGSAVLFERAFAKDIPGLVIGYEAETGDHAALYIGNGRVVSWGEVRLLDSHIEEAWLLDWVRADGQHNSDPYCYGRTDPAVHDAADQSDCPA